MNLTNKRKFFAWLITVLLFTGIVAYSLLRTPDLKLDFNGFVFQLATAYSLITGLFFGANVAEKFSKSEKLKVESEK